jgi:hypothetical protein
MVTMQVSCPGPAPYLRSHTHRRQIQPLIAGLFLMLAGSWGVIHAADAVPAASPDLHTFTNQDGRTIKAEILSAFQDDVNLKRDDGQSFKVSVTTLSKEDQSFIRQWVIQQAQAHHDDVLTFGAASVRTDPAPILSASKISLTSQWSEGFKINVTNQTSVHWTTLHLRYIIFRLAGVPGALPPNNFTPTHATGTVTIDDLPGLQQATASTDKIDLLEVSIAPGYNYANGAPPKVTDQIQGIWVRVYDDDNNLLQEWSSTKEITKDNTWDALWAPVARGRRGAGGNRGRGGSAPPAN